MRKNRETIVSQSFKAPMKSTHISKLIRTALFTGAALFITGAMTAQAASTFITFSVDMSPQITGGTFTNGVDTIEAHGTFNGYGALNLVQVGSSTVYTNTANDTTDPNGGQMQYKFVINGSALGETPRRAITAPFCCRPTAAPVLCCPQRFIATPAPRRPTT